MRPLATGATLLLISSAALLSGAAFAEGKPTVRFTYLRGAQAGQCPEEGAVRDAVAARLGYEPWDETAKRTVRATIEPRGGGLRARMELLGEGGAKLGGRELSSARQDCRELVEALELAICIAIDPLSITRPAAPAPKPEPVQSPAFEAPPQPPPATPEPPPQDPLPAEQAPVVESPRPMPEERQELQKFQILASAGAIAAIGTEPGATGGATVQVAVRGTVFSGAIEARADFPRAIPVGPGFVDVSLAMGSVVPCARFQSLSTCLVLGAGLMRASGHDLDAAAVVSAPFAAGGTRLQLEWPIYSRLSLLVRGDLLVALSRVRVQESFSHDLLWSSPALSAGLSIAAQAPLY